MATRKKRLAIITIVVAPYRVSQHLRIARELTDDIELWSLVLFEHDWQPWEQELPPEIRPVHFGKGELVQHKQRHPFRQWQKMGRVIRFLQEKQIDLVITGGLAYPGMLRLIAWCKRNGVPNFLFGDSNILCDNKSTVHQMLKDLYYGYAVRSVSGFLPCGTLGQQFFEKYGSAGKPCFYMPHEPDYRKIFSVSSQSRADVRDKFGLSTERKYIIFCGRLTAVKGIETLIEAYEAIAGNRPDWDLLIVGGGELETALRNRIPANLTSRIVWTGFINDRNELSTLFTCADVFVLPSRYEPWGVVVCEAAAAGLVILTSDVVGAGAELCREGVNGGMFPVGDSARLAGLLMQVSADETQLEAMQCASLKVLDEWRRRGDPVQAVRLAFAHAGLLEEPAPVQPDPPTPVVPPQAAQTSH